MIYWYIYYNKIQHIHFMCFVMSGFKKGSKKIDERTQTLKIDFNKLLRKYTFFKFEHICLL